MRNTQNPWADAANQAVGAMYKHYMTRPNPAIIAQQQREQAMAEELQQAKIANMMAGADTERSLQAKLALEAQGLQMRNDAPTQIADTVTGYLSAYNNPVVPADGSVGPLQPDVGRARAYEQFAPQLAESAVRAAIMSPGNAPDIAQMMAGIMQVPQQQMTNIQMGAGTPYEDTQSGFEAAQQQDFTLSPGAVRFDAQGQQIASAPFKQGGGMGFEMRPDGTFVFSENAQPGQLGATRSVASKQQGAQIELVNFQNTLNSLRELADKNPNSFGVVGNARSVSQDASILLQGVSQSLGFDGPSQAIEDMRIKLNSKLGSDLDSELKEGLISYDPSLRGLDVLANLAIFGAAAALAGQESRSVSDQDVKQFRGIVGDPKSFFMNQEKFLSNLNTLEQEVNNKLKVTENVLGGNVTRPMQQIQPTQQGQVIDFNDLPE